MGAFATAQAAYAERGVPTFPVQIDGEGGKRPAIRGWRNVGLVASAELAKKFHHVDALGFCLGTRSGVSVLDIDSSDERELSDALSRHGETPLVVRSGSGHYQAWYKHNGEGRRIRPQSDRPIDVLGGGFVVAPPSRGNRRRYEIIAGGLDDLAALPTLRGLTCERHAPGEGTATTVREGERNFALWKFCMRQAKPLIAEGGSLDDLLALAKQKATTFPAVSMAPLSDDEVVRAANDAWERTARGQNWFGSGRIVVANHTEVDRLAASDPDAFALLAILRRHHWGRRTFPIAKAMAESLGWRVPRFRAARARLVDAGALRRVTAGGRGKNDPPIFSFTS